MRWRAVGNLRHILAYGWQSGWIVAAIAAVVFAILARLSVPLMIGRIIDGALAGSDQNALLTWCALLGLLAVTACCFREIAALIFARLAQRALTSIREDLLSHVQVLPVAFFDEEQSGRLTSYFMTEARMMARIFYPTLSQAVLHAVQLAGVLGFLAVTYRWTGLVALGVIPLYGVFPLVLNRRTREAAGRAAAADGEISAGINESIASIREIKTFACEEWNRRRLSDRFRVAGRLHLRTNLMDSLFGLNAAIYMLTVAFMYWFGGSQVLKGQITVGELVALVWYMGLLGSPTSGLVTLQAAIQTSLAAGDRVFRFLGLPGDSVQTGTKALAPGWDEIVFDDVSFSYVGCDGPAIDGVSFRVRRGERIAIVGPSGAGKTTLFNLLLKFYTPQQGIIMIGSQDIREVSISALRQTVGMVSQEPILLAMAVAENIRLGNVDATDIEVVEAARAANAHDFIEQLADGYAAEVGERGVKLSVGQKQRIAIARVVLRDPRVLLLDEATSALDAESEQLVRDALERLMAGRITIMIAHRLASVLNASRILVLDRGRLIAEGRHNDLLAECRLYRRLVALQFGEIGDRGPEVASGPTASAPAMHPTISGRRE